MNKQSYKLLLHCSKGVQMGIVALGAMATYCKEEKNRTLLREFAREHQEYEQRIDSMIRKQGQRPKGIGRITVWFALKGIKMKFDKKQEDLAIMKSVEASCEKAISTLKKYLGMYSLADEQAKGICEEVISLQVATARRVEES